MAKWLVVLAFAAVMVSISSVRAQDRPVNDDFGMSLVIGGATGTVNGSTTYATTEPGEPEHAGVRGGASVWLNWAAQQDGFITLDTRGSGFDTVLAVYTGSSLPTLREVVANDDAADATWSQVAFSVVQGTTYHLAVDGYGGTTGPFVLNWTFAAKRIDPVMDTVGGSIEVRSRAGVEVFIDEVYVGVTSYSDGGLLVSGLPDGERTLRLVWGGAPLQDVANRVQVVAGAVSRVDWLSAEPMVGEPDVGRITGRLSWIDQFGTTGEDSALAVSHSAVGEIFVAGYTTGDLAKTNAGGRDAFVRRYDATGAHVWTDQYGGSRFDEYTGVAVADAARVVVAGRVDGSSTTLDMGDVFARAYDLYDGSVLWTRRFSTPTRDMGNAVAVDAHGAVIVGTRTQFVRIGVNTRDAFVWRIDPDGRELWRDTFGSRGPGEDAGVSVALDATGTGEAYIVGTTTGQLADWRGDRQDVFVRKYSRSGGVEWTWQLGTDQRDAVAAVTVDHQGGVILAGTTRGLLGETQHGADDSFVAKLTDAGDVLWIRQFGTSGSDAVGGVAIDPCGNIIVVGSTNGAMTGQATGGRDGFVVMMDQDGQELWVRQFGGSGTVEVSAVAASTHGQIVVAGSVEGRLGDNVSGGRDAFVALFVVAHEHGGAVCSVDDSE